LANGKKVRFLELNKLSSQDTLPNRKYLVTQSTMQGLCLDNNERFEPAEKALNSCSPVMESLQELLFLIAS